MATTEGSLLNVIMQWLRLNYIPAWRYNAGSYKTGGR